MLLSLQCLYSSAMLVEKVAAYAGCLSESSNVDGADQKTAARSSEHAQSRANGPIIHSLAI